MTYTREQMLDALWEQDKRALFVSHDQYIAGFDGWEVRPHLSGGELVAVVLTKGPEFHFGTLGKQWSLTRADLRYYLQPMIDTFGYVLTRTPLDDTRQRRFNKILGFVEGQHDEFFVQCKLERLRHA